VAGSAALSVERTGIALAERSDDAELRALLRRSVMPGAVRVALTREPNFFAADGLAGADDVTLVSRADGRIVGMGRMSIFRLTRNGQVKHIGYLGALRITSGTKESARMLRDGYRLLRQNIPGPVDGHFTSIASDNARARRVLENGARFGLPTYRPLCDLVTLLAPVQRWSNSAVASQAGINEFLGRQSSGTQLALAWDEDCLDSLARHGVDGDNFCVVRKAGEVVGCAAVWDQRAFRQTVIQGYSSALDTFRPVYNFLQSAFRRPPLPPPGSVLSQAALLGAFVAEPDDWQRLWPVVNARAAEQEIEWLTISRDARDPELAVLRRLTRMHEYRTTLYEVEWHDAPRSTEGWDGRYFRPEVGLL